MEYTSSDDCYTLHTHVYCLSHVSATGHLRRHAVLRDIMIYAAAVAANVRRAASAK